MKRRDPVKQAKVHSSTTKRALYEKKRKLKVKENKKRLLAKKLQQSDNNEQLY